MYNFNKTLPKGAKVHRIVVCKFTCIIRAIFKGSDSCQCCVLDALMTCKVLNQEMKSSQLNAECQQVHIIHD